MNCAILARPAAVEPTTPWFVAGFVPSWERARPPDITQVVCDAEAVGGEFMFKPRRESEIDHHIAAAKRSDQWQQERKRALRRVALAWYREENGVGDARCNNPRTRPTSASGQSR